MKNKIRKLVSLITCMTSVYVMGENPYTNFIIIIMDDMGYGDISCYGAIGYKTPNIDSMANEGMRFTHFYASSPVSGASRAGLMTGCYPSRISFSGAPNPLCKTGINPNEETIAEVLKKRGYYCAAFGKWHLGHHKKFLPLQNGFDEYLGIPYSNDMNYEINPDKPHKRKYPLIPLIEGNETIARNPDQSKFTKQFTQRALEVIEKHKDSPFFIYLAHPMPHVPIHVSKEFKGVSERGLYGDVMTEIDWSVGEILKKIKEEGIEENTLVIVTSDNGPWIKYGNHSGSTGGLREGKLTSFEGGQRVPCIMKWKGRIVPGSICNRLCSSIDFLPTLAAISGIELSEKKIDGIDMCGAIFSAGEKKIRDEFYFYYNKNSLIAVTDGRFKLVFPHKHISYEGYTSLGVDGIPGNFHKQKEFNETQLFDLSTDPGERYNVIDSYPEELDNLYKIADKARNDLGDELMGIEGTNIRPIGILSDD